MSDIGGKQQQRFDDSTRSRHRVAELEGERRFQLLAGVASPSIVFAADSRGCGRYINRRWSEITGLAPSRWIAEPWGSAVHVDDRDAVRASWQDALKRGTPWRHEFRLQPDKSEAVWVLAIAVPVHDADGCLEAYVGTCTEITDLQRHESDERLRVVLDCIPDIVMTVDKEHRIRFINRVLPGYHVEKVMGSRVYDYLPTEVHEVVRGALQRVFCEAKPQEFETQGLGAHREMRRYSARLTPVKIEGRVVAATYVVTDVTDQKAAEEKLERQERQLAHVSRLSTMGELVAGIAHEVNQPLHAISTFSRACANSLDNGSQQALENVRRWNEEIGKAARRAGDIIKRLRNFVIRTDRQWACVPLSEIVLESVKLVEFEARRLGVGLTTELAEPSPEVYADRVQIQQLLVNLLRNAFEAMQHADPTTQRVTVRTSRHGQFAEVAVEDQGEGLSDCATERLFDPFFTTKKDGMGMGLAISKTIIEAHRGQIWATPNEVRGATFHFALPCTRRGSERDN